MADKDNGISGWGVFFLILFIIVILVSICWIFFTQYRARRLGLPAPSLNPFARNRNPRNTGGYSAAASPSGGVKGWFSDKLASFRGNGSSSGGGGGGYESTTHSGRNDRRGFGPLDPDEAWDSRVGNEYYEEQELGLQDPLAGPYGGNGYGQNVGSDVTGGRGQSRQRQLDERYDEEMGLGVQDHGSRNTAATTDNPFADQHAVGGSNMRGVSPRPMLDTRSQHKSQLSLASNDSPSERRSMFRENM